MRICEGSIDNLKLETLFLFMHGNLSECNKKYNCDTIHLYITYFNIDFKDK